MVPSAKEAYIATIKRLTELIDPAHMSVMAERIKEASEQGRPGVMIKKEDFGLDGIPQQMRHFEAYLKAQGYRAEVGYGNGTIDIKWI